MGRTKTLKLRKNIEGDVEIAEDVNKQVSRCFLRTGREIGIARLARESEKRNFFIQSSVDF